MGHSTSVVKPGGHSTPMLHEVPLNGSARLNEGTARTHPDRGD